MYWLRLGNGVVTRMRRISVGLLNHPVKTINAKETKTAKKATIMQFPSRKANIAAEVAA